MDNLLGKGKHLEKLDRKKPKDLTEVHLEEIVRLRGTLTARFEAQKKHILEAQSRWEQEFLEAGMGQPPEVGEAFSQIGTTKTKQSIAPSATKGNIAPTPSVTFPPSPFAPSLELINVHVSELETLDDLVLMTLHLYAMSLHDTISILDSSPTLANLTTSEGNTTSPQRPSPKPHAHIPALPTLRDPLSRLAHELGRAALKAQTALANLAREEAKAAKEETKIEKEAHAGVGSPAVLPLPTPTVALAGGSDPNLAIGTLLSGAMPSSSPEPKLNLAASLGASAPASLTSMSDAPLPTDGASASLPTPLAGDHKNSLASLADSILADAGTTADEVEQRQQDAQRETFWESAEKKGATIEAVVKLDDGEEVETGAGEPEHESLSGGQDINPSSGDSLVPVRPVPLPGDPFPSPSVTGGSQSTNLTSPLDASHSGGGSPSGHLPQYHPEHHHAGGGVSHLVDAESNQYVL
ncbi:hypothetical protein HDU93_002906, partial [Gonapodya sp. JEL0774]